MKGKTLVNPDELAEALGIKKRLVYTLAERGAIPRHKVGGLLRFNVDEVMDHLHEPANREASCNSRRSSRQ